jgi:phenylacetate-CoA ligase
LLEGFERLKPDALPAGVEVAGIVKSSGTTGPPVQVLYSTLSNQMFTFLNQRHLRWFRRDPMLTLATLRSPGNMPQAAPGRPLADGEALRTERWTHVGVFFETGANVYFNYTNPVEAQLAWLKRERPAYLTTRAHCLEHLAMAAGGGRPCDSLKGMTGVSEGLTPETRRYLEGVFGAPVRQGYGLNEIGLVSALCEAGRHHVHREHCIVEIVDEAGMPVADGVQGRLVVTGLLNAAMPLLRYDTGDLVTALDGPCPCGRTLPAHGEVHGRLARIRALPPGTLAVVAALRGALQRMPASIVRDLRRYQIHQLRDGRFEVRLVAVAPLPEEFCRRMEHAWTAAAGAGAPALALREVGDIPIHTDGTKFDDFVSEYG